MGCSCLTTREFQKIEVVVQKTQIQTNRSVRYSHKTDERNRTSPAGSSSQRPRLSSRAAFVRHRRAALNRQPAAVDPLILSPARCGAFSLQGARHIQPRPH
jgi:hypothetical protein